MKRLPKKMIGLLLIVIVVAGAVFYITQNRVQRDYNNPDYQNFMENYPLCVGQPNVEGSLPANQVNFKNPHLYDLWKSGKGCTIHAL